MKNILEETKNHFGNRIEASTGLGLIEKIENLEENTNLNSLNLSGNKIKEITGLKTLKELNTIDWNSMLGGHVDAMNVCYDQLTSIDKKLRVRQIYQVRQFVN